MSKIESIIEKPISEIKLLRSVIKLVVILFILHIVLIFPAILIFICLFKNRKLAQFKNSITKVKYSKYFPLYFYYDEEPKHYRFNDVGFLKTSIQRGDVLLRRYDNYLDGLILSQTSYYTHAAIYYGEQDGKKQVIHAVGDGVVFEDIDQFAKCDSIAVLRFDFERGEIPDEIPPFITTGNAKRERLIDVNVIKDTAFDSDAAPMIDIRPFMEVDLNSDDPKRQQIAKEELEIYNSLAKGDVTKSSKEICLGLVNRISQISQKKEYDYSFNFRDREKFSCVEFVWYCYKFLYPLHQVRRLKFRYFRWVEALVIVPDLFLDSKFFKLVFTDHKEVDGFDFENGNKKLKEIIQKKYLNFWWFIAKTALSQIVIGAIVYFTIKIILQ